MEDLVGPLVRLPQAHAELAMGESTFNKQRRAGLVPEGVFVAPRVLAFPLNELQAVKAARIAGKSDDEIRAIVQSLHAARRELA